MCKRRLKRRKIRLWKKDSKCRNCGVNTLLNILPFYDSSFKHHYDNDATIEHLNSRLSGNRKQTYRIETTTLYCRKCNEEKARDELMRMHLQKRWEISNSYPAWYRLAIGYGFGR